MICMTTISNTSLSLTPSMHSIDWLLLAVTSLEEGNFGLHCLASMSSEDTDTSVMDGPDTALTERPLRCCMHAQNAKLP